MNKTFITGFIDLWTQTFPANIELTYFDETGKYEGYLIIVDTVH